MSLSLSMSFYLPCIGCVFFLPSFFLRGFQFICKSGLRLKVGHKSLELVLDGFSNFFVIVFSISPQPFTQCFKSGEFQFEKVPDHQIFIGDLFSRESQSDATIEGR